MEQTQSILKKVIMNRTIYLFILPAFVLTVIFSYIPMFGVIMAFQDFNIMSGYVHSPFVGFKYFVEFFNNKDFYLALRNTLAINFFDIIIGFPMPIIFALLLNELKYGNFKKVTQTVTYLPHFISWVVLAGLFYRLLDYNSGSVNYLIHALGGNQIAFFRESAYFWPILIGLAVWKDMGWNSIIYLAAMSSIDQEQYESAAIDGATRFQQIIHLTIPGIMPIASLMFILTIGNLFSSTGSSSFDAVYNLRNPMITEAAQVLDIYVYTEGVRFNRLSYASAIGFAQSAVSFFTVYMANAISRKMKGYGAF